jgi:hypothetical protein
MAKSQKEKDRQKRLARRRERISWEKDDHEYSENKKSVGYSDILRAFAQPMLEEASKDGAHKDAVKSVLEVHAMAWNIAVVKRQNPDVAATHIKKIPSEIRDIIESLIERKERLFAEMDVIYMDVAVEETENNWKVRTMASMDMSNANNKLSAQELKEILEYKQPKRNWFGRLILKIMFFFAKRRMKRSKLKG